MITDPGDSFDFEGFSTYEIIEELIGTDATQRLCRLFGGRALYIARSPAEWLVEAVGLPAAEKLCGYYASGQSGTTFTLPKGAHRQWQVNFQRTVEMTDAGLNAAEIAQALNIHERTVFRLRLRVNRKRMTMFSKRVASLLGAGKTPLQIAGEIGIAESSVRYILDNLGDAR